MGVTTGLAVGHMSTYRDKATLISSMQRSNQQFFPKSLVHEEVYTCEYNPGWLHCDALHPQE